MSIENCALCGHPHPSEYIRKLHRERLAHQDTLRDALRQLIDYVIDGCPEGSYSAVIEAKAALVPPADHS